MRMKSYTGKVHEILIEGESKKDKNQWKGRNSQNAVAVFDKVEGQKIGDLVKVFVYDNDMERCWEEVWMWWWG